MLGSFRLLAEPCDLEQREVHSSGRMGAWTTPHINPRGFMSEGCDQEWYRRSTGFPAHHNQDFIPEGLFSLASFVLHATHAFLLICNMHDNHIFYLSPFSCLPFALNNAPLIVMDMIAE